jgi:hypothetical protein
MADEPEDCGVSDVKFMTEVAAREAEVEKLLQKKDKMASSNWNLSKFRSEVLSGAGLSRTNRFEVVITPPPKLASSFSESYLSSLYVEQASLPLLNLTVKPLKIFGPSYQRPISSEYGGEGISLTFHVDREMKVRKFFENWMHIIVDPDTFTVGYQSDYIADVYIKQLDEQDDVTYEVKLIEAFPRSMPSGTCCTRGATSGL